MSPLLVSDEVFSGLAQISTLTTLDMSDNKIVSTLSNAINTLTHLETLTLNNNLFTGINCGFTRMTSLTSLTVSYGNKFTGQLTSDWYCRMVHLDMKMNQFAGTILPIWQHYVMMVAVPWALLVAPYGISIFMVIKSTEIPDDFFSAIPQITDLILSVTN